MFICSKKKKSPGLKNRYNELKTATCFLHHELGVALSASDNHIHPDPHGFGRGGNHIINSVMSLYAEGKRGIWALEQWDQGQFIRNKLILLKAEYKWKYKPYVRFLSDRNRPPQ